MRVQSRKYQARWRGEGHTSRTASCKELIDTCVLAPSGPRRGHPLAGARDYLSVSAFQRFSVSAFPTLHSLALAATRRPLAYARRHGSRLQLFCVMLSGFSISAFQLSAFPPIHSLALAATRRPLAHARSHGSRLQLFCAFCASLRPFSRSLSMISARMRAFSEREQARSLVTSPIANR